MSTLTVTNIQATGETATRAVSGVAAAWASFSGKSTATLDDSTNVSSLTDNGTGQYSMALSNSTASTNVSSLVTGDYPGGVISEGFIGTNDFANTTTSSVRLNFAQQTSAFADVAQGSFALMGDLA